MSLDQAALQSLYARTLECYPSGVDTRLYLPVVVDSRDFQLRIFVGRRNAIEYGLFLGTRYCARKMLLVRKNGSYSDETEAVPAFDAHEVDGTIYPTDAEMVALIEDALLNSKVTRSAY